VTALLAIGGLVLFATPASAHAQLLSTNPVDGAVLLTSPSQVVLHFDQAVETDLGSVRVLSTSGARVDEGNTFHPGGQPSLVAIDLQPHLPDGTYIVAWRVISADSHPVHGAFIFSVGSTAGAAKARALANTLAAESASSAVGILFWFVRVAELGGLILLVGLALVIEIAWYPGGATRRLRRLLAVSWAVTLLASILGIALQGVYASALPLPDLFEPSLVSAVLHTRYGEVELLRLILLLAAVPVLLGPVARARPSGTRTALLIAGVPIGLGLLATPGLSGHAATGIYIGIGIPADLLHLLSVSLWAGGLTLLLAVVLPGLRPGERPDDERMVMLRISALAFCAVCGIVITGVVLAIRQINSLSGLFDTTYGQLLIAKSSIVLVVIGLGALARRTLHGRLLAWPHVAWRTPTATSPLGGVPAMGGRQSGLGRRFALGVVAELALITAVLGVTGALINSVPPRQLQNQPFTGTWNVLGVQVNLVIEPVAAGPGNEFHFYVLGPGGEPKAIPELDAEVTLQSEDIGPLTIPLTVAGPGHYQDNNFDLPFAGTWLLRITVRTTAIDEQLIYVNVPVS
jgi:copper transport protein